MFKGDPGSWSAWLRRTLLSLPEEDADLIDRELSAYTHETKGKIQSYLQRLRADISLHAGG